MERVQGRKPWTTGKKILLILAIAAGVFVGMVYNWYRVANITPEIAIPMPTMPSPNAHDYFVRAGNMVQQEKDVGNALSTKPINGITYTQADREKLVRLNAPALKTLREGFAYTYWSPPMRSFTDMFPYYAKFRGLARLLSLEGQTRVGQGKYGDAMDSYLDTMRLGVEIPHGAVLIGELVGIACEAIGRAPTWKIVDKLDAKQSKAAIKRLEAITAKRPPYPDTLQEEKWAMQSGLQQLFRKSDWAKELTSMTGAFGQNEEEGFFNKQKWEAVGLQMQVTFYGKGRILNNLSSHMDKLIANAREPYATRSPTPAPPEDPISQIFYPVFDQARSKDVLTQMQTRLLMVVLALHAYKLEHGAYPEMLDQLAPNYLNQVPDDIFWAQKTLHYKRAKDKYLLYSVGPDGKDDNGTPIDVPSRATTPPTFQRYQVQDNSIGDIVAGTNTR